MVDTHSANSIFSGDRAHNNLWNCRDGRQRQEHYSAVLPELINCRVRTEGQPTQYHTISWPLLRYGVSDNSHLDCTVRRVKTATLTVDSETAQCCQLAVEPSRSMSKKVKRTTLQFVMKDPQVRQLFSLFHSHVRLSTWPHQY